MNLCSKAVWGKMLLWAAAALLAIALTGCGKEDNSVHPIEDEKAEVKPGSPQQSYLESIDQGNVEELPSHTPPIDREQDTSTENSSSQPEKQGAAKPGSAKTGWSLSEPQLHGISIGDSDHHVESEFGKELDRYSLKEETGNIQVLEYKGFAVGINSMGAVHFVEVYDPHIKAGLSGLKVGDKPEKAVDELGKPDSQSEYLLIYDAEGARLKLDVDPELNEIVSMKLLAHG
ncbi:hypothetical protein ACFQZE_09035 [Paenibacillus sp. GCM10027627]|uniref:hypothetical protein n=1 Tax=unclassified Paenibacillus TaxID=185978 RepID=UPI003625D499